MVYSEEPQPVVTQREVEVRPLGGEKIRGGRRLRGEVWRVVAAEACGTALLVVLSCLPACAGAGGAGGPTPLAQRALAGGLAVAVLVQCFDHVSGAQLNPTVTLAAALAGRIGALRAALMCAAQLVGGTLGATTLLLLTPDTMQLCLTKPASFISIYQALVIEIILGALLTLANLASWDPRNRYLVDSWPLRIGFTVTGLSLVGGDLTGASMNPVRSFAPALLSGNFEDLWVYWVGPLTGACVSTVLYGTVWRAPVDTPSRGVPVTPHTLPTLHTLNTN